MPVTVDESISQRLARVAFTGRLATMSRREANTLVERAGGRVTTDVSRRTSLLIVGLDGWPVLEDGSVSVKLQRAEALNRSGAHIRIAPETVLREMTGVAEPAVPVTNGYTAAQVSDLLGLDDTTLHRWEVQGLVHSRGGRYDFRDIVSLRTIAELVANGVSIRTIGRSIRGLASVLPDTERPLSQLKLIESSGTLLAELGEALVAPDGQLVMRFDDAELLSKEEPMVVVTSQVRSADEWFDHGHDCEEDDRLDEAIEAYREAISRQPAFAEAHYNLANCLRVLGRTEGAEEHLRMAVTLEPGFDSAWYNLADVQEEQGHLDEAIDSLVAALRVSPLYADAHYNLALCYEQAGRPDDARRHWREYLKLDTSSPWATTARQRLS
jgi:tetratricopeptide (TPR) repeat protein